MNGRLKKFSFHKSIKNSVLSKDFLLVFYHLCVWCLMMLKKLSSELSLCLSVSEVEFFLLSISSVFELSRRRRRYQFSMSEKLSYWDWHELLSWKLSIKLLIQKIRIEQALYIQDTINCAKDADLTTSTLQLLPFSIRILCISTDCQSF